MKLGADGKKRCPRLSSFLFDFVSPERQECEVGWEPYEGPAGEWAPQSPYGQTCCTVKVTVTVWACVLLLCVVVREARVWSFHLNSLPTAFVSFMHFMKWLLHSLFPSNTLWLVPSRRLNAVTGDDSYCHKHVIMFDSHKLKAQKWLQPIWLLLSLTVPNSRAVVCGSFCLC